MKLEHVLPTAPVSLMIHGAQMSRERVKALLIFVGFELERLRLDRGRSTLCSSWLLEAAVALYRKTCRNMMTSSILHFRSGREIRFETNALVQR